MAIKDDMQDVQEAVINELITENGITNTLADGQVTPANLSSGAPTWTNTGYSLSIKGNGTSGAMELNSHVSGEGTASIDFHSTSATNPDYDARIIKSAGTDGNFTLINTGSGDVRIYQGDKLKFQGTPNAANLLANAYNSSRISCYDTSSTYLPDGIVYVANSHNFKNLAQNATSSIHMNMTDDGDAELVVQSNDSSGEANLKLSSFTPSVLFNDKSGTSKDFQLLADNGTFRLMGGNSSGDALLTNRLLIVDSTGKIQLGGETENGVMPACYIEATRDDTTSVDRLELQADQIALMSAPSYATEALKVEGQNVYVPSGRLVTGGAQDLAVYTNGAGGNEGVVLESDAIQVARSGAECMFLNRLNSNGKVLSIRLNGTPVGSISATSSSTSYLTSSDYRLKENVVNLTGATERLKQLEPKRFNFIADADTTVDGFLAHEVSSIVPEAVTGTKDEVDADGNPEYQGIDQSKLVPLLVATIKELEARITALEQQLNI